MNSFKNEGKDFIWTLSLWKNVKIFFLKLCKNRVLSQQIQIRDIF